NVKLYHDVGAQGEGDLIYVGHNPSNGLTDDSFTFDLTTKDGTYKIPQQGTLRLNGYDAKLLLANYNLARQHLVYTTSDTQTFFSQDTAAKDGGRDIVVLHGRNGEDGETVLRYKTKPVVTVLQGKADSVYDAKTGDLRLNYTHDLAVVRITGGGRPPLLLLIQNTETAGSYWRQDTKAGPVLEYTSRSPSLIRAATATGSTLALTGDNQEPIYVEVWAPKAITAVTFNGAPVSTKTNPDGSLITDYIKGPIIPVVPDLAQAKWERRLDSPEANPAFDDSSWRKADMTSSSSTTQTQPPAGQPVLDMSQYGFHHGDVWYRGTFTLDAKAASSDTLDIHYGGGGSGFLQVWIDGKFVGQNEMPTASPRPAGTSRAQFNVPGLKPGAHEISIMVRNNSHNWDLGANDEHKEARGLIYVSLGPKVADLPPPPPPMTGPPTGPRTPPPTPFVPSFATKIDWKIQGNKGGEDIADLVRGPMNNGGLYGERLGWNLPAGGDADKPDPTGSKWEAANPTDAPPAPGTYWLRTQVKLDLPKDQDVQLGLVFGDPSKPQSDHKTRALIFINGWNMGNFAANVGPQRTFILPPGILDPNGNNTIALAVTTDGKPENALEPVKLVVLNNVRGGVPLELVSSPKTLSR
ncbi:MAG TPA: beta galactosidase jelly roll domain-containing protein, partial [Asticcacaulis sp.]|nr:beta galactosidase jelly roll domain-containing protein [Asticcacaulis sp.]